MSQKTWELDGVEPTNRARAEAEAARLGVNLADYLTIVLIEAGRRPAAAASGDRLDALARRVARLEQDAAQLRAALGADIERVEACTLAALEKLSQDIATAPGARIMRRAGKG